jgi:predicted DNA-binding transcriptional regulator YafY
MTAATRLWRIEQLIRHRGCVSMATLIEELEVSRATLKRDLDVLRDQLGAPITYDRASNGYRLWADPAQRRGSAHELPGLWFS